MDIRNMPPAAGDPDAIVGDLGGNPLQEGFLADSDNGWKQPNKRDESFASVQSAAGPAGRLIDQFAQGDLSQEDYLHGIDAWNQGLMDKSTPGEHYELPPPGKGAGSQGHSLRWEPGIAGRGMFIGPHLHTWPQDEAGHGQYAYENGGDQRDLETQFSISPEGEPSFSGTAPPEHAIETIDPRIYQGAGGQANEGWDFTGHRETSMNPYSSWMHQSDAEFETESVIPPGLHSVEVQNNGGLAEPDFHGASLTNVANLGVLADGKPIDALNDPGHFNDVLHRQGPVVLSHSNPDVLDLAQKIKERGYPVGPDIEPAWNEHSNPHKLDVNLPAATAETVRNVPLAQALGAFNFVAQDPSSGEYAPFHENYQNVLAALPQGGTVRVGHHDPEMTDALRDFTENGNPDRLRTAQAQKKEKDARIAEKLRQIEEAEAARQAKVALSLGDIVNPIKDVGEKAVGVGQGLGVVPKNLSPGEILFHNPVAGAIGAPVEMGTKALEHTIPGHPNLPSPTDLAQGAATSLGMVPQNYSPKELIQAGVTDAAAMFGGPLIGKALGSATKAVPAVEEAATAAPAVGEAPAAVGNAANSANAVNVAANGAKADVGAAASGGTAAAASSSRMGNLWDKAKSYALIHSGLQAGQGALQQGVQQVVPPPTQPAPGLGVTTPEAMGTVPVAPPPMAQPPMPYQGKTAIEILADTGRDWHPSSDPNMHDDPHNRADGDTSNAFLDPSVNSMGGTDEGPEGWGEDPDSELSKHGPKLMIYYLANASSDHDPDPEFRAFVDKHADGTSNDHSLLDPVLDVLNGHMDGILDDMHKSGILGGGHSPDAYQSRTGAGAFNTQIPLPEMANGLMNPGHVPVPPGAPNPGNLVPNADPTGGKTCPKCGTGNSPEATTCASCGQGLGSKVGAAGDTLNTFQYDTPQQKVPQPLPQSDFSTAKCAHCGAALPPGSMVCPQCNQVATAQPAVQPQPQTVNQSVPLTASAPLMDDMERTAGIGPQTPEQFQAVMQLLHDQGRDDEASALIANPDQYGKELQEAQNKQTMVPPPDGGLSAAPPAPAQEAAPPEATMPVPGMSSPMAPTSNAHIGSRLMGALERYADATGGPDNFAPRCPKCKGGSTGIVTEDGDIKCHSCGHKWKKQLDKDITDKFGEFTYISDNARPFPHAPEQDQGGFPNAQGTPAADQHHQRDVRHEQDSSLTWQDINGDPLHTDEEYEMRTPGVAIPDIIHVEDVKPDAINYTLTGEYGISHKTELTNEEQQLQGITFSPMDSAQPDQSPDLQENMDTPPVPGPGEQTDLSTPHVMMTHRQGAPVVDQEEPTDHYGEPLTPCPECGHPRSNYEVCQNCGDASHNPYGPIEHDLAPYGPAWQDEQRERGHYGAGGYDQRGQDPFYDSEVFPQTDEPKQYPCPQCGGPMGQDDWQCRSCGHELKDPQDYSTMEFLRGREKGPYSGQDLPTPEQLAKPDTSFNGTGTLAKAAGQHFSPREQREFVDEQGEARNLDKLALEGTHYMEDDDDDSVFDSILFL
jgi:ssDNA-binding Zn-finger/Zn-ribbon topoisomerase 1